VCSVELAKVQQDLGKLDDARSSLLRAISIGRAIKSLRCIRYALVGLGNLRITEAQLVRENEPLSSKGQRRRGKSHTSLLLRARAAIQRAIALEELELEIIIDGRYLLASIYFFLDDLETAHTVTLQTLKEAREYEITRITGRAYRLLGLIHARQKRYEEADSYFEQAIDIFRERELRLDYARTLHYFGAALQQRDNLPTAERMAEGIERAYARGLDYLREARRIFVDCHATIDMLWVEDELTRVEKQNAGKQ